MKARALTLTTLVGLFLAGLGIIVPILWDVYKGRAKLELQQLPSVTLIENKAASDEIKIIYKGEQIRQLTKLVFALVNTGRTAIVRDHLIAPPTISFSDDTEILDARVEERAPPSLDVKCDVDSSRKSASITFPLLNAGDRTTFALTVSGKGAKYSATARIVNVSDLTLTNRASQVPRASVGWSVYIVGFFTALFVFLLVVLLRELSAQHKIRKRVAKGELSALKGSPGGNYKSFVGNQLRPAGWIPKELMPLRTLLEPLANDIALSDEQHENFATAVAYLMTQRSASFATLWPSLILVVIGIWYIASQFV